MCALRRFRIFISYGFMHVEFAGLYVAVGREKYFHETSFVVFKCSQDPWWVRVHANGSPVRCTL